jgi:anti-sigma-K factor RskA
MATASPDHRERSWNRIVAGSREESAPAIEVRSVLRKELARITAERPEVSCLLDMVATWRIPSALAAAVAVLAGVSIFVLRDAPSFLADPILYLLTNR